MGELVSDSPILARAADFVWRSVRLLERQLFAHLFAGGRREPVLAALAAYQNPDGGFGNALEPDKRCPESQPIDAEIALRVLADVRADASSSRGAAPALLGPLCDFLASISTPAGGVPFALPSVRRYPRAPWWQADDDPPASINPTAAIAGLLHQLGVAHPWLDRATDYCWRELASREVGEVHELLAVVTFLEHVPDRPRAAAELERVGARLRSSGLVALDPATPGYVHKPLDWAPTPASPCRQFFADDLIEAHLAALAAAQQPDGGWAITWPSLSPAVELEARGLVTLAALKTLRAYARL